MDLLTVQETALILKVAPITVRRFIAAGRLAAIRAGKGVRIRRESIERFLEPLEATPPADPIGPPMTFDDPLWTLVGSATDAEPTDSSNKYEYLAEGAGPIRQ